MAGSAIPIDLQVTTDQLALLREAAARDHVSLEGFVLEAALDAARPSLVDNPRRSREEAMKILSEAREAFKSINPLGRDLAAELIEERRAESDRE